MIGESSNLQKCLGYINKVYFGLSKDVDNVINLILEINYQMTEPIGTHFMSVYSKSARLKDSDEFHNVEDFMNDCYNLLKDSHVCEFNNLVGVPVEVTLANGVLMNFRVLTEVIR